LDLDEAEQKRIDAIQEQARKDAESEIWTDVQGSVSLDGKLGVHQRIITAVLKDDDYRQLLLMAAFDNMVAQCAVKAAHIERVLQSMTSYTLNTNYGGRVPNWKKKQDNKSIG